jgi:hypothetical protein
MTNSGLPVRVWVKRLLQVRESQGRVHGPAFCDKQGKVASARVYESALMERLQQVQNTTRGVIPEDVEVFENFGISRSFRRGATSTARTRGVRDKHMDLINRWRKFESAKGRRPAMAMHEHYSDIVILIPELVKFSQAL